MTQQLSEDFGKQKFLAVNLQNPYENFILLTNSILEAGNQSEETLNVILKNCSFNVSGVAQISKLVDRTGVKLNSFILNNENYLLGHCLLFSDKVFVSEDFPVFPFFPISKSDNKILSFIRTGFGDFDDEILKNNFALLFLGDMSLELNLYRKLFSDARERGKLSDKLSEYLLPSKPVFINEDQVLRASDLEKLDCSHLHILTPEQLKLLANP